MGLLSIKSADLYAEKTRIDLFSSNLKLIIFDNDGTIYPATPKINEAFGLAAAQTACRLIPGMTLERAFQIAEGSFRKCGISSEAFIKDYGKKHGFDAIKFHHEYHKTMKPDSIVPDRNLPTSYRAFDEARRAAGVDLVFLTHGSRDWTIRSFEHNGIMRFIDPRAIFALEDVGMHKKTSGPEAYEFVMAARRITETRRVLVVEDSFSNLMPAKQIGMRTALVRPSREIKADEALYLDCAVGEIHTALNSMTAAFQQKQRAARPAAACWDQPSFAFAP